MKKRAHSQWLLISLASLASRPFVLMDVSVSSFTRFRLQRWVAQPLSTPSFVATNQVGYVEVSCFRAPS